MRLLVVDDDPLVRMAIRLRLADWQVVEVTTVGQALNEFADARPDVAVVDRRISQGEDGLDFVREVRSWEWAPQIPIVVCTAGYREEERPALYRAGVDGYLAKPFEVEDLRAELLRLISLSEEDRAVRRKDMADSLERGEVVDLDAIDLLRDDLAEQDDAKAERPAS